MASGDQADQPDQLAIAGDRAIEHIGEDARDTLVEDEIRRWRISAGEQPIGLPIILPVIHRLSTRRHARWRRETPQFD